MKVSHKWLETYFAKSLPKPEDLAELFNAHAFEVEGMEKIGNDTVYDIKILPDRAHYALCHRGIAGEASAITKTELKKIPETKVSVDASVRAVSVKVDDSKLCPRYMARMVEGLSVGDSSAWLKDRLEAIGSRSINNIVDATNFVMFDIGQPLHAFDADKVKGGIIVRKAKAGELITLLDGREVALLDTDLVIADSEGPLAIAGVKGGKRAEVTTSTKNIIIESANFNPTTVRKTSTRTNLRNDSSKRFENEITPALAEEAMNHVTALIAELSKGSKAGALTDIYPNPAKLHSIKADVAYMNAVTGLDLSADEMADILVRLQCKVEKKGEVLLVTPTLDRLDLVIPEDIADEIGRLYGYENLEPKQTPNMSSTPIDPVFYWSEAVKNILVSKGFSETLLYTLVPKGSFEVSYPMASDKSALRESLELSPSLLMNTRNADLLGLEVVKIFEIGKVFPKTGEKTALSIGVSQVKKKKGITPEDVLKDALLALESGLGIKIDEKLAKATGEINGVCVKIDFDALVTKLGSPKSLVDLSFGILPKNKRYVPFSHYPFIVRDIALFVSGEVGEEEVQKAVHASLYKSAGKILVKGPVCFDRFEKDGKKSFAFRMIFQSFEKTLSDEEANSFMAKLYEDVKKKGWEVR